MVLLSTKRAGDKHSDFLEKIVEHYSVIEYDTMTGDELVIHLFVRDADQQMSNVAQEVLRSEKPTIHELQTRQGSCKERFDNVL